MLNYAICEILGKQYKVVPGKVFEVNFQKGSASEFEANVLLISEKDKVKIGKPYLKEKLRLKRVGDIRGEKIRVSKFHAKANYRKTVGFRPKITRVMIKA